MAGQSLDVKTDEIYGRRNEKGKEAKNYQDAEKQLLAIQAAQQQNLKAGKINNLAQYQNSQNLINAGNAMNQANASKPQTQQVTVNQPTQQILQKYGATKPGTITKTTHSQQVTKQNITINNNTTNTTNNQIKTIPNQVSQAIRPQKDNSNEKFKLWLNNTLARQQEEYARREKDYDKRESALTRDSNKMLRKLGEFSKDMMEKMDPRNIGSTATSQIKSLLFIFGFQYLATNWVKILRSVSSIERSFKAGLAYFGLYNMNGQGNFCFRPGESQLAYDLKGLFTGTWGKSPLWQRIGGGSEKVTTSGTKVDKDGGIFGGEHGWAADLRKMLFGDDGGKEGGKDKGLINIIKDFFVLQGKKRMAAAKMVEKPEFPISDPGAGIKAIGEYFGQLLRIFLGDPDEALRDNIRSKIDLDSRARAIRHVRNYSDYLYNGSDIVSGAKKFEKGSVKLGAAMYHINGKNSLQGLSFRTFDDDGNLITSDAEGTVSQTSDLALVAREAREGKSIETERYSSGFSRLYNAAVKKGKVPVTDDFLDAYLTPDVREKYEKSGDLKKREYTGVVRLVDAADDLDEKNRLSNVEWNQTDWFDEEGKNTKHKSLWESIGVTGANAGFDADSMFSTSGFRAKKSGKELRLVYIPSDEVSGSDDVTNYRHTYYEISPKIIMDIVNGFKEGSENTITDLDLANQDYLVQSRNNLLQLLESGSNFSGDPTSRNYKNKSGEDKRVTLSDKEERIFEKTGYYIGDDEDFYEWNKNQESNKLLEKGNSDYQSNFLHFKHDGGGPSGWKTVDNALERFKWNGTDYSVEGDSNSQNKHNSLLTYFTAAVSDAEGSTDKDFIVRDPESNKLINLAKILPEIQDMSSEELQNFFEKILKYDFNPNSLVTSTLWNSGQGKGVLNYYVSQINSVLKDGGLDTEITIDRLKDPESLRASLVSLLKEYGEQPAHGEDKTEWDSKHKKATRAIEVINNILGKFTQFVKEGDREYALSRKNKFSEIFQNFIVSRRESEQSKLFYESQVQKLKADPYTATIAASNLMSDGSEATNKLENYNQYSETYGLLGNQFKTDVSNNSAASAISNVVDGVAGLLSGVKESFDDYSADAKSWLGDLFDDAKSTVNDFLRNLDYTKVSLTKYPANTVINKSHKLLIWKALNGWEGGPEVNFMVKGADGRFGAGRINYKYRTPDDVKAGIKSWMKHVDTDDNRARGVAGKFDRIHEGQDISTIIVDGTTRGYGVPIYAPFNGFITGLNTDISGSGGKIVQIRQANEGKPDGRYSMTVMHLSEIPTNIIEAYKTRKRVDKGSMLGKMGGSGLGALVKEEGKEGGYGAHFHINIQDHVSGGPFDGPLKGDIPGVVSGYQGFQSKYNYGAVDPLFVFYDEKSDSIINKTLYLSSDKKVVYVDEANPSNISSDNYKGGDIVNTGKDSESNINEDGKKEGEGDKKEGSLLERAWGWLKDLYMKYLSGGIEYMKDKAVEYGGKAKDFAKEFFGKYRNKSMSFRRSSRSYSGQITPEFVNYQNYLKNPGKIPTKPDGTLLTEAEWRNEVFDMTGSDPVSLKLGEFLHNGNKVKTADQVGGEVSETVNNYQNVNNNNSENTEVNTSTTEGTPTPSKTPPTPTPAPTVVATKDNIVDASNILGKGNTLTDAIESYGTDPAEQTANNTKGIKDGVNVLIKAMGLMQGINLKGYEALLASGDVNNRLTAANAAANSNSNNASKQVREYNQSQGQDGSVK